MGELTALMREIHGRLLATQSVVVALAKELPPDRLQPLLAMLDTGSAAIMPGRTPPSETAQAMDDAAADMAAAIRQPRKGG
jgi:hypothetical protein